MTSQNHVATPVLSEALASMAGIGHAIGRAIGWRGVKPCPPRGHMACGAEQYVLSIRRPTACKVDAWMIRDALRHSAHGGNYEYVRVAVILPGERDRLSVRREIRIALFALRRCQPSRFTTFTRHPPEIAGIVEHQLALA